MTKREQQLIGELHDRYPCRLCDGIHYPLVWMTKTREKLVRDGALTEQGCPSLGNSNVSLKITLAC